MEAGQTDASPRLNFELSAEQRTRAVRRARRRLAVMLVVTATAVALAALFLREDQPRSTAISLVISGAVALAAAWTGLFVGYARVSRSPTVYDAVDAATRNEIRRALWLGTLPSPATRPALAATLQRNKRLQPWTVLFSAYVTVRAAMWAQSANHLSTRTWYLAIASVMAAVTVTGGWQLVNARRLARRLDAARQGVE